MLPTAEAGVVRRERHLPGMGLVLDPEALVERLNTIFVESGVESASIQKVHYEPGTSCIVSYEIKTGQRRIGLYAKAYRPEDLEKLRGPRIRKAVPGAFGPGRVLLGAPAVILYFFPNDHHLRRLCDIFDGALAEVFPDHCGQQKKLETVDYRPEHRYSAIVATPGAQSAQATIRIFATRMFDRAVQSSTVFVDRGSLRVEPVLGMAPRFSAVLFGGPEGQRMQQRIVEGTLKRSEVELAIDALEDLHRQTDHGHYFWNFAGELAIVAETIGHLCPPLGDKALQLAGRLLERLETSKTFVPSHGNWNPENVEVGKRKITFTNLDGSALAPPALDPGTFLAYLERQAIYGSLPSKQAAIVSEMLMRACQSETNLNASECEFFTAYALFRNAAEPFARRESDWSEKIELILTRAEQRIQSNGTAVSVNRGESGSINGLLKTALGRVASRFKGVRVEDPYGISADPAMPFLQAAVHPDDISRRMANAFPDVFREGRLVEIQVKSYRPAKRCTIEYEWTSEQTTFRVSGTVDVESQEKLWNAQQAIWQEFSGSELQQGMSVVRPIGILPDLRMRLYVMAGGSQLPDLYSGSDGPVIARRCALLLHKFHSLPVPAPRKLRSVDELNLLRDHLTGAARIRPVWASRLERILDTSQKLISATPEPEPCLIHGNFYPEHVFMNGNTMTVSDPDSIAEGNPALDAGTMIGAIKELALRKHGDPEALLDCEESFRETYLESSRRPLRQPIKTFSTLSLAHQIYFSTLSAERSLCTGDLIELCEKRLDITSKSVAPSSRAVFKVR